MKGCENRRLFRLEPLAVAYLPPTACLLTQWHTLSTLCASRISSFFLHPFALLPQLAHNEADRLAIIATAWT